MNELIFDGDDDILLVWDSVAEAYKPIACITSNTIDGTTTFRERLTKCSQGSTELTPRELNKNITVDGLVFDTTSVGGDTAKASYDWLDKKQIAGEKLTIKNTLGTLAPVYFYAFIETLSRTSPAAEDVTFTSNMRTVGVQMTADPNA